MRNKARTVALNISCRFYSLVMPLYPVALRCQFGPDMADVFEQQIRRECDRRGFAGLVRVWYGIALDAIQSSLPSEINWQSVLVPVLSLAGSFALFVLFFVANGLANRCVK
jgi:hypothetical protein